MDSKKIIAVVIGLALSVAGALIGYDFKGDVCKGEASSQSQSSGSGAQGK